MDGKYLVPARYRRLSGFALKWIAVVSMIIDHFGSIVMDGVTAPYSTDGYIYFTADMPFFVRNSMLIGNVCDALGSVAFPIFCFLIAEGFIHTRSRLKYGVLLGVFALVSELPYDLAHYGEFFNFSLQNVMFTLCVGVFTLYAISLVEKRWERPTAPRVLLTVLAALVGAGLAFLLRGEYVFLGVAAITLFYVLRGSRWRIAGMAPLLVVSPWVLLALIPLLLYSGVRGRGSKYFFYVFYPAHFLLFYAIARLLAARPL